MNRLSVVGMFAAGLIAAGCASSSSAAEGAGAGRAPHVVFVTGDEEYRSEESMPMLGKILKRDYGFRVTVCYSLNEAGYVDPMNRRSITGLEALKDADLMVIYTRFRDLPAEQMQHFFEYFDAGKPIVGFRTATHAFKFDAKDSPFEEWGWKGETWAQIVGQNWIIHHGHFGDGFEYLTDAWPIEEQKSHPIMRGVGPFKAYSWLYHVEGGGDALRGDSQPLMMGRALKSRHAEQNQTDRYPLVQPIAWTKTYRGKDGQTGRVFFNTAGHSFDFRYESMRKLSLNGILWALGMENRIPADGARADFVGEYDPNNSGGGKTPKHKPNLRPADLNP